MSKSLEALEKISNHYDNWKGNSIGFMFEKQINTIKHDIEEYEKYKQQWSSDIHCWVEDKIGKLFVRDTDEGYIVHLYEMEIFNELLANVDKLLYENQNLKIFVNAYANTRDELLIKNEQLEKENQELTKEKSATILLMKLMALDPNNIVESALILDKYKKAIDILKEIVSIPLEDDFAKVKLDKETKKETHFYALSIKYLIDEQKYELLKEVLE